MNNPDVEPGRHAFAPLLRPLFKRLATLVLVVLIAGCAGAGQRPRQYTLDYEPVAPQGLSTLPETITVERFTTAQLYRTTAMVYREEPNEYSQYLNHSWRVNPADLVTDCLLRDLRRSGIFQGAFSHRNAETSRYRLAGAIEEFHELVGKDGSRAVLSLYATLFDMSQPGTPDRLLFQKNYRVAEPVAGDTPGAVAAGMSRAMAKASELLLADILGAVRDRR